MPEDSLGNRDLRVLCVFRRSFKIEVLFMKVDMGIKLPTVICPEGKALSVFGHKIK